jgi:hypothetical protein
MFAKRDMLKNAAAFLASSKSKAFWELKNQQFLSHQKSRGFLSVPVGAFPLSRLILNPLNASQYWRWRCHNYR